MFWNKKENASNTITEEQNRLKKKVYDENSYISFCKDYCEVDCSKKIELTEINAHFFAKCFFNKQNLCKHIEHPDNESIKRSKKFFSANHAAREAAGLLDKEGKYEFICPNCGTECYGSWVWHNDELHGGTGCPKCNIGIRV